MKYLIAILAAFALIAATTSWVDNGYPPERYQHAAVASEVYLIDGPMEPWCGEIENATVLACTKGRQLFLQNPCKAAFAGQSYARLACHELGHLNGWPGNHPRP